MRILIIFLSVLIASTAFAQVDSDRQIFLEIYNRDQALVREVREFEIVKGLNTIDIGNISDAMFGSTAMINPLEDADRITTKSFSFRYDLLSHDKLIRKYVGRWFSFSSEEDFYEGKLLRIDKDDIFLQPDTLDPMIHVIERTKLQEMYYQNIPEDLFTEPILRWEVDSRRDFKQLPVELTYLTSDIYWVCDYRAEVLSDNKLNLSAVFVIVNDQKIEFEDAHVNLIAGSTHRSDDPRGGDEFPLHEKLSASKQSAGERFFEYYRYSIENPLTLEPNQTIMVPFFERRKVNFEKRFEVPHLLQDGLVRTKVRFENSEKSLPEGNVAMYKRTDDDYLSFLGEDFIHGTSAGSTVEIDVGAAFDLTAKRMRMAQARPERDTHQETWRVEISSNRDEKSTVYVEQRVFGYYQVSDAKVDGKSIKHETETANIIYFPVEVEAGDKAVLTFKLTYGF